MLRASGKGSHLRLLVEDGRPGGVDVGPGLVHARLVGGGVEAGDDLPAPDGRVEVGVQLLDLSRDLAANRHGHHGGEGAIYVLLRRSP